MKNARAIYAGWNGKESLKFWTEILEIVGYSKESGLLDRKNALYLRIVLSRISWAVIVTIRQ